MRSYGPCSTSFDLYRRWHGFHSHCSGSASATIQIFVISFAAAIPIVINTITGVQEIDPVLLAAARVNGAKGLFFVRHVIIPGALPYILIGLRLAMQTCWTVLVAAELLGAIFGVGKVLDRAGRCVPRDGGCRNGDGGRARHLEQHSSSRV